MRYLNTLEFIWNHPLAEGNRIASFARFSRWQLSTRLLNLPVVVPFVNGTSLVVSRGLQSSAGNYYLALRDFQEMAFVMHALAPDDLFVDVGANIGSYSICGASVGADVLAVEPIPATFRQLTRNIGLNGYEERISAMNIGLGSEPGVVEFTSDRGGGNHVWVDDDTEQLTTRCDIATLDSALAGARPNLLQIDVEGYEYEVLAGASETLNCDDLHAIVIETNGLGSRYGIDDAPVHSLIRARGFVASEYDPTSRELRTLKSPRTAGNTIYVRDSEEFRVRLRSAPAFAVGDACF